MPERELLKLDLDASSLGAAVHAVMEALGDTLPVLPKGVAIEPAEPLVRTTRGEASAELGEPLSQEPVYSANEQATIQGNIIPGFNKDHQEFLFLRIDSVANAKTWLQWIAPKISSLRDVLPFVRAHRAARFERGVAEPGLTSCWINIGFSHSAIARLVSAADADAFGDESFLQGLSARSSHLGDPTDESLPGNRTNWVVGGPDNEADILVIVAADSTTDLDQTVAELLERIDKSGVELVYRQRGDALPGALSGHEHFGFKDGVSQPGVRGRLSDQLGGYITPRFLKPGSDPNDPRARIFAKPGQALVWPGEFLLGEPRQSSEDFEASAAPASNFPSWAKLGSYMVCRRLNQDVVAFWSFATASAHSLGMAPEKFASMLVGRWMSGAPVMRVSDRDDPALGGDPWANNHFVFDDDTRPSPLTEIPGYSGDNFYQAKADVLGSVCPHFSHIRKINPRDNATDLGKAQDGFIRMILRRGIPFGPPIAGVKSPPVDLINQERGLMFLCYGATIEDQFEFLSRRWANTTSQPNFGGHDPIIGQTDTEGDRERTIEFPTAGGIRTIKLSRDWVVPTGGGYFFAPPIDAISKVLGA
ncbi:MAG: Dyp-type peroxidase [Planctomycetota bacterium]